MAISLERFLAEHRRLAVAFSGGLDSRFLCAMALACGCDVLAVHATGSHVPEKETAGARAFAAVMGLKLVEMAVDPLQNEKIAHTDPLRCYHCKKFMLVSMRRLLRDLGQADRTLCDGSNHDDLSRYRPGLRALEEEHVLSPLALGGLGKKDIRRQAQIMGFPLPEVQSRPCLLTRYDYHLPVHREDLVRLEHAETSLLALKDGDGQPLFDDLRIRLTPAPVLQVTAFRPEWRALTDVVMANNGFSPYDILVTDTISGYYDARKEDAHP